MRHVVAGISFDAWRSLARELLVSEVSPSDVTWSSESSNELHLFGASDENDIHAQSEPLTQKPILPGRDEGNEVAPSDIRPGGVGFRDVLREVESTQSVLVPDRVVGPLVRVPKTFLDLARTVLCHRDDRKYALLYRTLWRIAHGEHELLKNAVDDDVNALMHMEKAVRRDCHKMTAFVRFKKVADEVDSFGDVAAERYIAWHRPDHLIVRRMAKFFVDRFRSMRWAILTPDSSVMWENDELTYGPGVPADPFAGGDEVERLWTTYYANIFNPARIKLKAMQAELPKKHWPTLPETRLIPQMLADAPGRVKKMLDAAPKVALVAEDYVPKTSSLTVLREAADKCRACDIGCHATQAVFGEGPKHARLMFVGEQPGDQEDLAGRPFVGPSGALLNEVLDEVGIDRSLVYVTNAVKHFKFEQRGKRRIHAKPNAREMAACKPWLMAELEIVKPEILVMLGATAAQTLVGRQFRITQSRGEWFDTPFAKQSLATFHPSAILRSYDADTMERNKGLFTEDLRKVAKALRKAG